AAMARLSGAMERFTMIFGGPITEKLTNALNNFADLLNRLLALLGASHGKDGAGAPGGTSSVSGLSKALSSAMWTAPIGLAGIPGIGPLLGVGMTAFNLLGHDWGAHQDQPTNPHTLATQENTKALQDLSAQVSGLKQLFAHGPRAESAMPSGISGQYLRMGLEAGGFRLNPF
ncbi:MAG TPA: hypothetical protein VKT32_00630, partial [Chthonomonadaceae bacterium]|nr:hypothetical protein [Chthonomonadaceae bacterium]